ncbi:hypothetical protein F503_02297 [Ophiostoma piceae UAMH 11346]|uniref:Uncharacterized protein n=1 Tax=Ophiostoma piceae (strain UAMH 11346) TaxID=1262450 RepID=S3CGX2_OPHP1|nr:hypothetical protein F503_02297 [Ophiostoma piceae UAMH 11346]
MNFYQNAIVNTLKSITSHHQKAQTPKTSEPGPPRPVSSSTASSTQSSVASSATASTSSDDPETDSEDGGCRCWFRSTKHRANDKKKPKAAGPRPHAGSTPQAPAHTNRGESSKGPFELGNP